MCDLFWTSPAEQGDLSDVVRASLHPPPPQHRPWVHLRPAEEEVQQHGLGMVRRSGSDDVMLQAVGEGDAVKRRKSQTTKKVVCIPFPAAGAASRSGGGGEVVPSDLWAWRKYGQKPIKGSPYPRGYYRCSSSKGCSARKQVERSRTDPTMLVITYTSDHNHPWPTHRNALAGSSRHCHDLHLDLAAGSSHPQLRQDADADADAHLYMQQEAHDSPLFDPFSFSFFDWASSSPGEPNI